MLNYSIYKKDHVVVFLHGFMEDKNMWKEYAEKLSFYFNIYTIDLPGHGESKNYQEVHTMEFMATQIKNVLLENEVEKCTIIGHSMGGYVALAFADLFPEMMEGLGLFFSTTLPDDEEKKEIRLKAVELVKKDKEDFIRLGIPNLFNKQKLKEYQREIKIAINMAEQTSLEGILASLKGMRLRSDRTHVLFQADYPILIISGIYDEATKIEPLKAVLPKSNKNIEFHELPIGHMGHLEAPEETFVIIKDFLNKINPINH